LPEGIANQEIEKLLVDARHLGISLVTRKAGNAFDYGGANFRVLAPNPALTTHSEQSDTHRNDESLVMRVAYGKTSVLLEADAVRPNERFISTEDPQADVSKVAHHGRAPPTAVSSPQCIPNLRLFSWARVISTITRGTRCWKDCRQLG
jgi:beta-lactamase superfamily II metal-dependent hydrolase